MQVLRAATAGFCMGVSIALHKLDRAISNNPRDKGFTGRICTFGPIIHNPQVLADYASKGVGCLKDAGETQPGDIVLIRAHGIPREEEAALNSRGATIIDATCPKVKKAQTSISSATKDGSILLLFGEADHPEVRGLISYAHAGQCIFVDINGLQTEKLNPANSYVLAAQTTQDAAQFEIIRKKLESRLPRLKVLSTICDATGKRQAEARDIASHVDAMVIVGGRQSGNTRRLAALAAEAGVTTHHVERITELAPEAFAGVTRVGLTAGASTPKALIDEADRWLTRL